MNHRKPAFVALCLMMGSCAAAPSNPDLRDPYERINRATFRFNDALDRAVARPVTQVYRKITPRFAQTGVSHFMANAGYPTVILNDLLQAKFTDAAADLGRLLLNSTLGLGGLLDPATAAGLEVHDEDFGQTLGKWGVKAGPYLVLPVLGPSTIRDAFGLIPDQAADPRQYIKDPWVKWSLLALRQVGRRSRLMDVEAVLDRASDKYVLVRSVYLQRRAYQVSDGNLPDQPPEEMDDPAPESDSPQTPVAPPKDAPLPGDNDAGRSK